MNYWLQFIPRFNLFNQLTLETPNPTMDSTVELENAQKVGDDVANKVAEIKPRKESINAIKEVPEKFLAQIQKNAELVKQIHAVYADASFGSEPFLYFPEVLQVWIFFVLYILRIPEHRNATYSQIWCEFVYLRDYFPHFVVAHPKPDQKDLILKMYAAFRFYHDICLDDTLEFNLVREKDQTEPSGVYLKKPDSSWDAVHKQMIGVAFPLNNKVAEGLIGNLEFQRAFSIILHQKVYYLVTGPVTFAQHVCSSKFEPSIVRQTFFRNMKFSSTESDPQIDKSARWYQTIKNGNRRVVETAEFVVHNPGLVVPSSICKGCSICSEEKGNTVFIKSQCCLWIRILAYKLYSFTLGPTIGSKVAQSDNKDDGRDKMREVGNQDDSDQSAQLHAGAADREDESHIVLLRC
jgi:hypothetical protein